MSTFDFMSILRIGKSTKLNESDAIEDAVTMALQGDLLPKFALLLTTDQYDPHLIAEGMNRKLPGIKWAGCTSAAVFAGNEFIQKGLVIGLMYSPGLEVGIGVAKLDKHNCRDAGRVAVDKALKALDGNHTELGRALIVLADSSAGNIAEVIRGAVQEAGTLNVWAGGGVGNVDPESHCAEFAHGQAYSSHVLVIALQSSQLITTGVAHGWKPYGPPTLVTHSKESVTHELEYEKAFAVYQQTAANRGEKVTEREFTQFAITHPLGIPQADGNYVIRDPVALGSDGSLSFIAEVPDGCLVRIMQGGASALLAAAQSAAESSRLLTNENVTGAFIFDCISRFFVLKSNYSKELDTFQQGLGATIPFMGCLTLGEVGAFGKGVPQFHNKTAVVMALHG